MYRKLSTSIPSQSQFPFPIHKLISQRKWVQECLDESSCHLQIMLCNQSCTETYKFIIVSKPLLLTHIHNGEPSNMWVCTFITLIFWVICPAKKIIGIMTYRTLPPTDICNLYVVGGKIKRREIFTKRHHLVPNIQDQHLPQKNFFQMFVSHCLSPSTNKGKKCIRWRRRKLMQKIH